MVASSNPVHAALSLVGTLFGIAVLFVAQEANFLAAVQVIVYAGAIVVLFLFVIMLLGVDRPTTSRSSRWWASGWRRPSCRSASWPSPSAPWPAPATRPPGRRRRIDDDVPDINRLGESLFTDYLFAFEITSILLVIAVVGAVLLARRGRRADEIVDPGQEERAEEIAERMVAAEARAHPERRRHAPSRRGRRHRGRRGREPEEVGRDRRAGGHAGLVPGAGRRCCSRSAPSGCWSAATRW